MNVSVIFSIILGAVIGSFLNVVIYRIPLKNNKIKINLFTPSSHCPNCKNKIPYYYNIPIVGWIILNGKCASCKRAISKTYLFVEALTAVLFFSIIQIDGINPASLSKLFIIALLIPLAFIDMKTMLLPDVLTLPLLLTGLIASLMGWNSVSFEESCVASIIVVLLLRGISWGFYKIYSLQALGLGDVKLYAALSAYLGLASIWSVMLYSSLLAIMLNMLFFRRQRGQKFAYGPYIISVAIIFILFH